MTRVAALGVAAALYVAVAWAVPPGFFDGIGGPQYDYVNPPAYQAPINVQPKPGSGTIAVGKGGAVATPDRPVGQAAIFAGAGVLAAPSSGGDAHIAIQPYDVPANSDGVTLIGNVYCFTADTTLTAGRQARISLLWPVDRPPASAMYRAAQRDAADWTPVGGSFDPSTYLFDAMTDALGCFALGYPTPKPGQGPSISGSALPVIVAVLVVVVVLAGLPGVLRRRLERRARPYNRP